MYAVQVQHEYMTEDGYTASIQIPTFYLDENVQGIRSENHARSIAVEIVTGGRDDGTGQYHVSVVKL